MPIRAAVPFVLAVIMFAQSIYAIAETVDAAFLVFFVPPCGVYFIDIITIQMYAKKFSNLPGARTVKFLSGF